MASNFQSSFIPKEPVTEEVFKKKKAGFFGVLIVLLFIASIIISIALYVYKGIVKNNIENLNTELIAAKANIDTVNINKMSQFSKKLSMIETLVNKHQVASNFLEALASSTVSTIQFTGLEYGYEKENELAVVLHGKAVDYASIALQEDVLSKNKYFKSLNFSNLSLSESGSVVFDLAIAVDPQISVYTP